MKQSQKKGKLPLFTLGCVESFTGGLFAAAITALPGASRFFRGGVVTYAQSLKTKWGVNVSQGVVSAATALSMSRVGRKALKVDLCVAFTGWAGGSVKVQGTPGLCYIAFNDEVYEKHFAGSRTQVRKAAVAFAVKMLKTKKFGFPHNNLEKQLTKRTSRNDIIKKTLKTIESKFGDEAITTLGAKPLRKHRVIPTGSFLLDDALGVGGYPKGRITEIFGSESSGKTTLALHAIANVQKAGGVAAFIDAEHAVDPKYAKNLGINTNELILSQPDSGEQALEIANVLVNTGAIDLVVVDSVAALVPQAELSGDMQDTVVGGQARMMSKALRKVTATISKTNTTVIFINQIREKIGVFFGNPEVTPGGRALKFYASVRIEIKRLGKLGEPNKYRGNKIRIRVVKNKLAPPFKSFVTTIVFAHGISCTDEILDCAEASGDLQRKGAWYYYNDKQIAQGRSNVSNYFQKNPRLLKALAAKLRVNTNVAPINKEKQK